MFGGGEYAGVDEAAGIELRARFFGRAFKGEVRELGEGGVWGDGAVVGVGGGVVDDGDDEVVGLGDVLIFAYQLCT